jgi:hypothetical protein
MENYIEQYQAKQGGVTLHTWTDVQGSKKGNFYITGVSGTTVATWFRAVLHTKHLADIAVFPASPSDFGGVSNVDIDGNNTL